MNRIQVKKIYRIFLFLVGGALIAQENLIAMDSPFFVENNLQGSADIGNKAPQRRMLRGRECASMGDGIKLVDPGLASRTLPLKGEEESMKGIGGPLFKKNFLVRSFDASASLRQVPATNQFGTHKMANKEIIVGGDSCGLLAFYAGAKIAAGIKAGQEPDLTNVKNLISVIGSSPQDRGSWREIIVKHRAQLGLCNYIMKQIAIILPSDEFQKFVVDQTYLDSWKAPLIGLIDDEELGQLVGQEEATQKNSMIEKIRDFYKKRLNEYANKIAQEAVDVPEIFQQAERFPLTEKVMFNVLSESIVASRFDNCKEYGFATDEELKTYLSDEQTIQKYVLMNEFFIDAQLIAQVLKNYAAVRAPGRDREGYASIFAKGEDLNSQELELLLKHYRASAGDDFTFLIYVEDEQLKEGLFQQAKASLREQKPVVFLVSENGHWFTLVADENKGKIYCVVADTKGEDDNRLSDAIVKEIRENLGVSLDMAGEESVLSS